MSWCTSIHYRKVSYIHLYFHGELKNVFAENGDIDDIMIGDNFLAMLGTSRKVSRIARYLGCVGKVGPPQSLQALKTKVVAARQARRRPFASAISGADTPKFRKHPYTCVPTWKLRRNSLVLHT